MPEEKELGLNTEENTSAENNHSDENNTEEFDNLDQEIDDVLDNDDNEIDNEVEDDDDTVVLSKTAVDKLKNDRDNYRAGLKSIKDKIAKRKETVKESSQNKIKEDTVTQKDRDKQAIEVACEDTEINDNWSEIVKLYKADGLKTVAQKIKGIKEAKTKWQASQSSDDKEDKKVKADLSSETGKPSGQGGKGGSKEEKHHVIPRRNTIQNWYPKKE